MLTRNWYALPAGTLGHLRPFKKKVQKIKYKYCRHCQSLTHLLQIMMCFHACVCDRPVKDSVMPPSSVLTGHCLYGAHILGGERLTSLLWPDLFILQAHLQLSNIHQNTHSLGICAAQSYITSLCNCPPPSYYYFFKEDV